MTGTLGRRPFRHHGGRDPDGEALIQTVAGGVLHAGLCRGESGLVAGRQLWRREVVRDLHTRVQQDVSGVTKFEDKLLRCTTGADDDVIQLAAELVLVCLLPLKDKGEPYKRKLLTTVIGWMQEPVEIPTDVQTALQKGVFNGGQGYSVQFWPNYRVLVTALDQWTEQDDEVRDALCTDPFAFRDFVMSLPGPNPCAERFALNYLAYPDVFEATVSSVHRKKMLKAFQHLAMPATDDPDKGLAAIRDAIEAEAAEVISFYDSTYLPLWNAPGPPTSAAPIGRAWWVRSHDDIGPAIGAAGLSAVPATEDDLGQALADLGADSSRPEGAEQLRVWKFFLFDVSSGDLLLTTQGGAVRLGTVAGPPAVQAECDRETWFTRPVTWRNDCEVAVGDLPPVLASLISTTSELVDLSAQHPAIEQLCNAEGGGTALLPDATESLSAELIVTREWLQECIDLLRDRPQMIFYGPPGTGKTWLAQRLGWHLAGRERTTLVQFHPSYSYEDFFEGYRPVVSREGILGFTLAPGPFRRAVERARREPEQPHVIIIDEINRGNLAKIFGELYFLLEYRDEKIELLYARPEDPVFTLPENVFVIGTMNTVDRSIALVDTAMRRRFSFVSLHPAAEPTRSMLRRWLAARGHDNELAELLEALNSAIEDPDFKVGPSYFMRDAVQEEKGLDRTWRTSILPLLEEHYFGTDIDVAKRFSLAKIRSAAAAPAGEAAPHDVEPASGAETRTFTPGDEATDDEPGATGGAAGVVGSP